MPKPIKRKKGEDFRKSPKQKHEEREEALRTSRAALAAEQAQEKEAQAALANLKPPAGIEDGVDLETAKRLLRLSRQDIEMLNLIASGRPPRNSASILAAIKLKLDATVDKPQSKDDGKTKPVNVIVKVMGTKGEVHEADDHRGEEPAGGEGPGGAGGAVRELPPVRPEPDAVPGEEPHGHPAAQPAGAERLHDAGDLPADETHVLVRRLSPAP